MSFVEDLEAAARRRFVNWDEYLWKELMAGPAVELASGLEGAGAGEAARPLLESYLRLGCEAIGLGYLFPAATGVESFFTFAWTQLIPALLPRLPAARAAQALAACWNLGENLESSPPWLRRIFYRLARGLRSLDELGGLAERVGRLALEPPAGSLAAGASSLWISLADEDRRFLPGALHFVAPTVVCVHDRQRTAAGGREAATVGVWLADPPLVLGAMG